MKILSPCRLPATTRVASLALLAGLAVSLPTARSAFADGPRPLQPEDVALLRTVGDPRISPDGASVAYTVGTTDLAKDKRAINLWLARWDGSENRALTSGENKQTHPRWSPGREDRSPFSPVAPTSMRTTKLWLLPV